MTDPYGFPKDEALKRAFDRATKLPVAGVTTAAFVGVQQLFGSAGAYVRLWIKGTYQECVCKNGNYLWQGVTVPPTNLGDYYLNHPEDQQMMVDSINKWVAGLNISS